jgi:putative inorganic carbon (HCO3(-)) transporter
LAVGNFPQEGILQFPLNIYFYLTIALINIALRLDIKKNPRSNTAI